MATSEAYDVSVELRPDIPTWDGEPGPCLRAVKTYDPDGARVSELSLGVHAGTHVDAPVHFIPGAAGAESLPIDAMLGPCQVVEVATKGNIGIAEALAADLAPRSERVLFKTRNSALWDGPTFRTDFTALEPALARWLVDAGARLVGIDYLSVEPYGVAVPEVHLALLEAGVVILEGLDLRRVPAGRYDLVCLPLKLRGSDGAPARVVLRPL
ncbi:MAG: cyclase family protein [Chloroflexi bacterium]|nr:cyclase family protein [Chloroflexota bacterium]